MNKLKHRGKEVKTIKNEDGNCGGCLFIDKPNCGENFENNNKIKQCIDQDPMIKYIYA